MKFEKTTNVKGAFIPRSALALGGFAEDEPAELHALPGAVILLKKRMTAMELLTAARSLHELSVKLNTHLAGVCGQCDNCGENSREHCPLLAYEEADIALPDYLRQEAGIPEGANLCAAVDEEEHTVAVFAADYDHDLRDLPPETLEMFTAANVCLGELEERLIVGDIVYGR